MTAAAMVREEAKDTVRMRSKRMNQSPNLRDDDAYSGAMCSKFAALRQYKNSFIH
jgi:hypothetical protein